MDGVTTLAQRMKRDVIVLIIRIKARVKTPRVMTVYGQNLGVDLIVLIYLKTIVVRLLIVFGQV